MASLIDTRKMQIINDLESDHIVWSSRIKSEVDQARIISIARKIQSKQSAVDQLDSLRARACCSLRVDRTILLVRVWLVTPMRVNTYRVVPAPLGLSNLGRSTK